MSALHLGARTGTGFFTLRARPCGGRGSGQRGLGSARKLAARLARTVGVEAEFLNRQMLVLRCRPRVKRTTPTPPTLDRRAVDCRSRAGYLLPSGTRALGVARCLTSSPPQDPCSGVLPEFASSITAPFARHMPTMATLRVTLLVATLWGLALLVTAREAAAGPIPGSAAWLQCTQDSRPCRFHRLRCAECVTSCAKAQRVSAWSNSAGLARDMCSRAKA